MNSFHAIGFTVCSFGRLRGFTHMDAIHQHHIQMCISYTVVGRRNMLSKHLISISNSIVLRIRCCY